MYLINLFDLPIDRHDVTCNESSTDRGGFCHSPCITMRREGEREMNSNCHKIDIFKIYEGAYLSEKVCFLDSIRAHQQIGINI
jgi:hypothetical protein